MKNIRLRTYIPEEDFIAVRDFLNNTYSAFKAPVNWSLDRWNYARYFIAPYLGCYGLNSNENGESLNAIKLWEKLIGVWENEQNEIVGIANITHPHESHRGWGEIFIQRHPDHSELIPEMLEYGENNFINKVKNQVHIFVYEDDEALLEQVKKRGYKINKEAFSHHLEYIIQGAYNCNLPAGYTLRSMKEDNLIAERCEIFGRSFNHPEPENWPSLFTYRQLQSAPDYNKENDFYITDENNKMVAMAIVWFDKINRIGHLEPLGTHPDHRGKGLAQELMNACFARLKHLGAEKMPMTGGFEPFYEAIGFKKIRTGYMWEKQLN